MRFAESKAAEAAFARAQQARADLNLSPSSGKTIASDGDKTISYFVDPKLEGFTFKSPEDVYAFAQAHGYTIKAAGGQDQIRSGGFAGKFFASHAEKQQAVLMVERGSIDPIGVTSDMCVDCRPFFSQLARDTHQTWVVTDTKVTRVFLPDGTVNSIPPVTAADAAAQLGTAAAP